MINLQQVDANVKALKELKAQQKALELKVKRLEEDIKSVMTENNTYELEGEDWRVTWNLVESNRFSQSLFKEAHPKLFEKFQEISSSRRFQLY